MVKLFIPSPRHILPVTQVNFIKRRMSLRRRQMLSAAPDVGPAYGRVARKRNRPRPRSTATSAKPAASSLPAKVSGSTGV